MVDTTPARLASAGGPTAAVALTGGAGGTRRPGLVGRASAATVVLLVAVVGVAACGRPGAEPAHRRRRGTAATLPASAQATPSRLHGRGTAAPCAGEGPTIGGCPVFPADNPWNTDISGYPVHPNSAGLPGRIAEVGGDFVHPDFGSNPVLRHPLRGRAGVAAARADRLHGVRATRATRARSRSR